LDDILPFKLTLEPYKQPAEAKEEIVAIVLFEVGVQFGVHELDQHIKGLELAMHSRLINEKVGLLYNIIV
jgi:hypothetical protein